MFFVHVYSILPCSGCLLTHSLYELCIACGRGGDIQQQGGRVLGRANVALESYVVES